uniref:Threonylcarbamoyladenosine tRNA methylthiotransferase n=1 Tax=Dermatophagoides pteronyssinus TaxID=6956 RepID=A0A6P6Y9N9_DERPT|nr:threonylcarbamoyladenosine tRNA methylthiotransferase-like [Dermatophagoides pteronyssinus]
MATDGGATHSVAQQSASYVPRTAYFYDPDIGSYYYGSGHPMKPQRVRMAHSLILSYDLYKELDVFQPHYASMLELTKFHSPDYVDFLASVSVENYKVVSAKLPGVEEAFYLCSRVMTVSFHRYGDYFPGTGSILDVGGSAGKYYSVNVPLKAGMTDEMYVSLYKDVVAKCVEVYQPRAIVLQCGADSVAGDRLGCFNLSTKGHGACVEWTRSLQIPLVILGGGGYTIKNVARTWLYETAVALGKGAEISEEIPRNEYYQYYGPNFQLHLSPNPELANKNSEHYCNCIREKIFQHFVQTFGCSHNVADGETMQGVLKAHGFSVVSELADGDVVVVNSCTVKNPSESSALNLATTCRAGGKFVVLAGCVVQADVHNRALAGFSCIGVQQLGQIGEAVLETMKGTVYRCVAQRPNASTLTLPHLRRNALVEIIPISSGCLGNCTYCKTRFARAQLRSFHPAEIVQRVKSAVADGVQQIWLTSEDTGAWGLDIGLNLAHLLYEIDDALVATEPLTEKCVMVRIGMTNPPYILDQLPEICDVLNRKHWFKWIHIPVQSGSNAVLAAMNREYTREEFLRCCTALRENVRGIVVATDFICGFPGETDAQHAESLSLLENLRLPVVNISQFYPRPGTIAAAMKRVPTPTVKLRSREMTKAFASYETFDPH